MRHRLAYLAASVVLALPLTACGGEAADTDLSGIEVETMDCDAEDKRKNEVPDCGRYVGGKFKRWSWVAKGSKPPNGWTPGREPASASKPAPKTSTARKSTGDKKTTSLDGRSQRTTSKSNGGGTRRR